MRKITLWFLLLILLGITIRLIQVYSLEISLYYQDCAYWLYPSEENRNAETMKIILTAIGGLGVVFTLYLSYKRAKAGDKAIRLQGEAINKQSEQLELTRKSQIDERFKNAVEHLGSDKEPIILGGIVELHQIAKEEDEKYASVVFNILTSYLRTILKASIKRDESFSHTIPQSIIDFLFRGNDSHIYKGFKANLGHCNFNSLDLDDAKFIDCIFTFSLMPKSIANVSFENSKIGTCDFNGSLIENVNFRGVNFFDTLFDFCEMKNVDFYGSRHITQSFINCRFYHCQFISTDIYDTKFLLCHFSNVSFKESAIAQVNYSGSNFLNCEFTQNKSLTLINFSASGFDKTVFDGLFFKCNFTGIRSKYQYGFIQLKDVKENINKAIDKTGIMELDSNEFSDCEWEVLLEHDYTSIEEDFNTSRSKWEEKYKITKTAK